MRVKVIENPQKFLARLSKNFKSTFLLSRFPVQLWPLIYFFLSVFKTFWHFFLIILSRFPLRLWSLLSRFHKIAQFNPFCPIFQLFEFFEFFLITYTFTFSSPTFGIFVPSSQNWPILAMFWLFDFQQICVANFNSYKVNF